MSIAVSAFPLISAHHVDLNSLYNDVGVPYDHQHATVSGDKRIPWDPAIIDHCHRIHNDPRYI
jgi:hypothetical protein